MNIKIILLFISFLLIIHFNLFSQEKNKIHTIAFYNVENLFDTLDNPSTYDDSRTPYGKDNWTSKIYWKKVENMSKVISEIGYDETNALPTIVGLCEVENKDVIVDLVNTEKLKKGNYGIVHYDSPDERGIDVALIYKKNLFKPLNTNSTFLDIYDEERNRQDYTRDQLVVEGYLENEKIYLIVNHWPSRSGGELRSRPFRNKAAELNRRIIDSIQSINKKAKIITMGDFNDDPINESIKKILNTKSDKANLGKFDMYNPMEKMHREGRGTLAYRDNWNLFDQIIFSSSLISENKSNFSYYKTYIYSKKYLYNQSGRYKGYPFRSFAGGSFLDGYSDHLPVYILLIKEIK